MGVKSGPEHGGCGKSGQADSSVKNSWTGGFGGGRGNSAVPSGGLLPCMPNCGLGPQPKACRKEQNLLFCSFLLGKKKASVFKVLQWGGKRPYTVG